MKVACWWRKIYFALGLQEFIFRCSAICNEANFHQTVRIVNIYRDRLRPQQGRVHATSEKLFNRTLYMTATRWQCGKECTYINLISRGLTHTCSTIGYLVSSSSLSPGGLNMRAFNVLPAPFGMSNRSIYGMEIFIQHYLAKF